jgi:glucose-1-phosphate cytidylyltransferase
MKMYAHHGFRDLVLCLGYRGNTIKDYFLNYEAMNNDFTMCLGQRSQIRYHGHHTEQGFSVTLADTGLESMTGGRVRKIQRHIDGGTFLLTYGDGVSDVNIGRLLEFHKSHGRIATVTTVPPISRFGMLEAAEQSRVLRFTEKPKSEGWMNAGFFALEREVFDYLGGDECIFEREPLERLATEGQLMAYRHEGFFYAMKQGRAGARLRSLCFSGSRGESRSKRELAAVVCGSRWPRR